MQKYVIALYIRLSIEDYKYDSLSIENQSLVLHEYAASMPEALNAEIMEFIDNGYSGTNFERPQVQKLIELVRANQIDCIIVKDFSRFGRNSIETGYFIERVFPLFHTRFISISDDFDSSKFKGDTGGMDVAFKYLISEYYSRDMSIKTKSAKYAKMQRGEYQSKICPYGYRKSADGRMEPDPEAAAVVQLIFQLAAEGINATAITRELFRRSIPTPGQYKAARGNHTHDISRCHGIWSTSTILRILEDERYTGVYVIGKRAVLEVGGTRSRLKDRESWYIIPDHHPAIIEKAVFDTVQASQLRFSQPNKKKRDYPLKGKAFCGCCGHALSRTMQKTSYYYCRHSEADEESRCHKMRLNAAELEQAVFLTLKKQMEAAAPLAGGTRAWASAGQLPLIALPDLLRRSSLLVTGDTGPMHLAVTVDTPVVALFAVSDPARSGPGYDLDKHVIIRKWRTCDPCYSKNCPYAEPICMDNIAVDEAVAAVDTILSRELA